MTTTLINKPLKGLAAAVVALLLAIGLYWYYSPFQAIRSMRTAIELHDAQAFNEHVDYPRLRESLREQLSASMADKLAPISNLGNLMNGLMPGIGGAEIGDLGMAMVDQVVDAWVRPETMMRAVDQGRLAADRRNLADGESHDETARRNLEWSYAHAGPNKLIVYRRPQGEDGSRPSRHLSLVFERSGFSDWKLTELRLPTPGN